MTSTRAAGPDAIDTDLATLSANAGTWARCPMIAKVRDLEAIVAAHAASTSEWVAVATEAKRIRSVRPC
jgi:hypothetical protein